MPKYSILKFRRGNTAVSDALIGAEGELFVDLQANTLVMHDGITTGGHRIATKNDIINIQGVDNAQNTNIQTVYDQANSSNVLAQAAFDYANTLNSSLIDQPARDAANGAFDQANTSANDIITIQGVNDTQNTDISNANNLAQGAFDAANAIVIPNLGNYTFDGDTITNSITNSITLQTGGDNWIFGTDGSLIIPNGGGLWTIGTGTAGITANIENPNDSYLGLAPGTPTLFGNNSVQIGAGSKSWNFDNIGELNVPGNIVPNANNEYSLGSPEHQWKSLFISNNTIYIENIPLSLKSNGNTNILTIGSGASTTNLASETYVQAFQNIDGGSATAIYSYELLNLDGGGA